MNNTILITSFSTWKSYHITNSSDDLLHLLSERELGAFNFLRKLPVEFELAPQYVLAKFNELRPKVLICCGMADLRHQQISHDVGEFVCNTLYYKTLEHLSSQEESHHSIFVHVPLITEENKSLLVADFISIIERLSVMSFE